jgi:hypothetical protein
MGVPAKDQGLIPIYFGFFHDFIIELAQAYSAPNMGFVRDIVCSS